MIPFGSWISGLYPASPTAPGWADSGGNPCGPARHLPERGEIDGCGRVDDAVDDAHALDRSGPGMTVPLAFSTALCMKGVWPSLA